MYNWGNYMPYQEFDNGRYYSPNEYSGAKESGKCTYISVPGMNTPARLCETRQRNGVGLSIHLGRRKIKLGTLNAAGLFRSEKGRKP